MTNITAVPGTYVRNRMGNWRCVVGWTSNGDPIIPDCEFSTSTVVPAAYGWFALQTTADDPPEISRSAIVAWRVVEELHSKGRGGRWGISRWADPIPDDPLFETCFVLRPDGTVLAAYDCMWDSEQEWFAEQVANATKQKESAT